MTKRMALVTAAIAAAAALMPVALAAPAHAAAYRYWSYWLGSDGQWSFSNMGASSRTPADGTVEGWRFSVSGVAGNDRPSFAPDFDTVCADTPAQEGRKRVAVVVDPGVAQDAPDGEMPPGAWALCVVAEPRATGYDVLRAAAPVRVDSGLICAIGGYPATECAVVIDEDPPEPTPQPSTTPSPPKSPAPSKTPKPSETPTSAAPPASQAATDISSATASSNSSDESPDGETPAQATPRASASDTPSPTMAAASSTPPTTPTPTPTPSLSVLAAPVNSGGGGGGSPLVAGAAVVGIGILGGGAALMMRRRPT